jgi:hypothetical protein
MKRQTIIWTALPNGMKRDGKLRLSVLVSPRLETDEILPAHSTPVLQQFPDFKLWPPARLTLSVKFKIGATEKTLSASHDSDSPLPDPTLWTALFKDETFVRSHEFDRLDDRIVRSYPVMHVLDFLKTQYQKIATATPTHFPPSQGLADKKVFGVIAFDWHTDIRNGKREAFPDHGEIERELDSRINRVLIKRRAMPPSPKPDPAMDFYQLKLFHRPLSAKLPPDPKDYPQFDKYKRLPPNIEPPKIDFHQMVSMLGEYCELMVRLGLVINLEITVPPGVNVAAATSVQVVPHWTSKLPPAQSHSVTPRTHITAEFRARPGGGGADLDNGLLRLNDENTFGIVQVDVDGGAIKAMNFASSVMRSLSSLLTQDTPSEFSVPALQSAGLAVVKTGRALELVGALAKSTSDNGDVGADKVELFAEDIVRGYRVDVWDERSNKWHSLCQRVGNYHFLNPDITLDKFADEGQVSLSVTHSTDESTKDLYLPESIFRWAGWSLCAPRPGTRIDKDMLPEHYKPDPAVTEFKLITSFTAAPGSLPRLRFGNVYRIRARVVDTAGNSLDMEEAHDATATRAEKYLRFEPVTAPAIVLRDSIEDSPGESPERLVIHCFNDKPEKDGIAPPSPEVAERHIVLPMGAPSLAEAHGKFDDATGLKKSAYEIITRREGTLEDTIITDLATGAKIDISGPAGVEIIKKMDGGKVAYEYPVHHEAQLILPYLPDPLARGAAFLGLPEGDPDMFLGLPGAPLNKEKEYHSDGSVKVRNLDALEKPPITLIKVDFGPDDDWPEWKPFLLRIDGVLEPKKTDVLDEPKWDKTSRVLRVVLPQAEIAKVRLSIYLKRDDPELMGIWNWTQEANISPKAKEELMYYALQGRHWMLTPYRDILFVHAVQQPLGRPKFQFLNADKRIGETFATLTDRMEVHVKSTGKIDILAVWNEPVDDLSDKTPLQVEPKIISGNAQAFEVKVQYPKIPVQDPKALLNSIQSIRDKHEFGDTKYRSVTYTAVATSRFREYFSSAIPAEQFTRVSDSVTLDILNSARPAAPKVLYVIPTFEWPPQKATDTRIESTRAGGGLRVYMDRPWYSSGDGERLGVVLFFRRSRAIGKRRGTGPTIPDRLRPYVTRWGADPISVQDVKTTTPTLQDFRIADVKESNLSIEELADVRVSVAGHQVYYDEVRQLWYCDIEIDTHDYYFPFVRLALARYQPKSVVEGDKDVKLSRIVLADFVQLAPARSASISFDPRYPTTLQVAVTGVRGRGVAINEVEVSVERRNPDVGGELGWMAVLDAQVKPKSLTRFSRGILWLGAVTLPERSVDRSFRLVIKEYEVFFSNPPGNKTGRRLVYADTIEV